MTFRNVFVPAYAPAKASYLGVPLVTMLVIELTRSRAERCFYILLDYSG